MGEQTFLTLNDGTRIPQVGLGVYQVPEGEATVNAVKTALDMGIRHIDTAHAYQNERSVGKAVRESAVARGDVWITSKLWPSEYGRGVSAQAIDAMLARLNTDYIDLLLLHQQFGDYRGAWADMEDAVRAGKVRSIGLSNFESERLEDVLGNAQIMPSVVQVECHPYYQQGELKKRLAPYGTLIESWYPLGHGDATLLGEALFTELGDRYGKTNAQIILRWHIQEGFIVFPRTTQRAHMEENFDIFDFELTGEDMERIRALDAGRRFFTMTLAEQEKNRGAWKPAD